MPENFDFFQSARYNFIMNNTFTHSVRTLSLILSFVLSTANVFAEEEDYGVGYEGIVRELSRLDSQTVRVDDPLEEIKIHAGAGIANAFINFRDMNNDRTSVSQPGFQLSLGIDLFSPNWAAESSVRNFTEKESSGPSVSLQEYDLKFLYKNRLTRKMGARLGTGVAARFLKLEQTLAGKTTTAVEKTASGIAFFGLEGFMNEKMSVGADFSYRPSLVESSREQSSVDLTMRVEAHF